MKVKFKEPRLEVCAMLVTGVARRHSKTPFGREFEAGDPLSMRAAYEREFEGTPCSPAGGYFEILIFLARVEGRMNYQPGTLIKDNLEMMLEAYWVTRCKLETSPDSVPAPTFPISA